MTDPAHAAEPVVKDLVAELEWRGLLHQCTDREGLEKHLASGTRKIYAGFDPTADSLTIGNLVPIMMLAHVKRAGHVPVVVMGGGTGLIGDPSGKSAERTLMTEETVANNIGKQRPIFDNVLGQIEGPDYDVQNNADWLGKISYLEALRDIGKFFSVNMMMQKESVKARLESREQGISYTEFSYMILQAYDFAYLYEEQGVTVQFGGSDQFGNIVAGGDLIRRKGSELSLYLHDAKLDYYRVKADGQVDWEIDEAYQRINTLKAVFEKAGSWEKNDREDAEAAQEAKKIRLNSELKDRLIKAKQEESEAELTGIKTWKYFPPVLATLLSVPSWSPSARDEWASFGLTAPLVKKADGGKFGKTETGAVWLTSARTSPYAYYQFWLNASDEDAANWIKVFTFLPQADVEALLKQHAEAPGARALQRTLAQEATKILHGPEAMAQAEAAGKALFSGDIASLDEQTLREVLADVPSSEKDRADLAGEGYNAIELLKEVGLAASNREAREFIANGSVTINGEKLTPDTPITPAHLLHGSLMAIRRGKKNWHLVRWS